MLYTEYKKSQPKEYPCLTAEEFSEGIQYLRNEYSCYDYLSRYQGTEPTVELAKSIQQRLDLIEEHKSLIEGKQWLSPSSTQLLVRAELLSYKMVRRYMGQTRILLWELEHLDGDLKGTKEIAFSHRARPIKNLVPDVGVKVEAYINILRTERFAGDDLAVRLSNFRLRTVEWYELEYSDDPHFDISQYKKT